MSDSPQPRDTTVRIDSVIGRTVARSDASTDGSISGGADPQFAAPVEAGDVGQLGRFRVQKKIGAGGMGAVYLGYDAALDRKVALKVMLPNQAADPAARERFLREARAAARVKSDHVVTIFDVGEAEGNPFIAMEYLLGTSLERYIDAHGALPLEHVLRVGRETALGLAAAHELGLVHRDIKPANLWLEAPNGRIKLLDFGLAQVATDDVHLTDRGAVVGTPVYMSPEQGRGEAVDHRSDLFSLGSTLYRLCTGRLPFDGPTTMAVLSKLALDTPPAVREFNPAVPQALEAIITKLLVKNPDGRFQTALEVAAALRAVEQGRDGPTVVPMALRVEAQAPIAPNVWEGIDDTAIGPPAPATELVVPSARSAVVTPVRRGRPKVRVLPVVLSGAVLAVAVALLAGVLLRLSQARLVVESDDPDAELVIKRDGKIVHERTKERELSLRAGSYTAELVDPKPGVRVVPEKFDLTERGSARVRVVVEKPRQPGEKLPASDTPDRKAARSVLSVGAGFVRITGFESELTKPADLPSEPFTVTLYHGASTLVTDEKLAPFKDCTGLLHLDLFETHVTDAGLANFKNCKKLQHLNLALTPVTDAGLAHFKDCKELVFLYLSGTQVSDAGLGHLKECKNLTALDLSGTKVTGPGLASFRDCKKLAELNLYATPVTDAGLAHLKDCKNLTSLVLSKTQVSDAGLEPFKDSAELVHLDLGETRVTGPGLASFQNCQKLTNLSLRASPVTDAGLSHFRDAKSLVLLDLSGTRVGDVGLAHLKNCTALAHVSLPGTRVTDAGLAHLKDCTGITELSLANTRVTDAGLAHFKDWKNLQQLFLDRTSVSDVGLAHLKGCKGLLDLNLTGTRVTDAGLAHFKDCKNMRYLLLWDTRVTDVGLAHFKDCTNLQRLDVRGTKVSAQFIKEFAEKLPQCQIHHDGGVIEPRDAP